MVTKMEVKAYIGAVKKVLWHVPKRREIAKELRQEIDIYLAQNTDATMADVYKLFGTPETIRAALIADMAPDEVEKQINRTKLVCRIALVTAAVLICLFIAFLVGITIYNANMNPGYYDIHTFAKL